MLSALWPPLSPYSGACAVPRYDGSRQENEGSAMSHTKEASQRRRRTKAVPVLGAAGLSFSLATGASAAIINPDSAASAPVAQQVMDEEEISDVSLASFRVFATENGTPQRSGTRLIMVGQGACGADLYYPQNPPAVSASVYQTPPPPRSRPVRPAHKSKRW